MAELDRQILEAFKKKKGGDQQIIDAFRQKAPGLAKAADRKLLSEEKKKFLTQELIDQGVDVESGGPAFPRAELSLTPEERSEIVLDNSFGSGNWRYSDLGVVVKVEGQEILLDEVGFSVGDFADMAGSAPEVAAAIGGTAAAIAMWPGLATGGVLSLGLLAVVSAASGQLAGGVSDLGFALKNGGIDLNSTEDQELIYNIVKRRGTQAAVDFVLDFALAGGAKLVVSPKGRAVTSSPQTDIAEAAARRDVPLSVGEKTGSETFMRAEALTEKVPGGVGPIKKGKEETTSRIRKVIDDAVDDAPTAEVVGEAFSDELTQQFDEASAAIESGRSQALEMIDDRIAELKNRMATRGLSSNEAGELSRKSLVRARDNFKAKQRGLEDIAEQAIMDLDETQRAFIPTQDIKGTVAKLRAEFPKTSGGKSIDEFVPAELKRFFAGVDKLPENVTVTEIRKLRSIVSDAIDDDAVLPGIGQGVLKQIEASLTRALKAGAERAPNEDVKYFLNTAIDHYRLNNQKFRTSIVAKAFRGDDRAGFVEGENLLPGLMKKNRVEDVKRYLSILGPNSIAVKASRRAVFEDMLHSAQNSLLRDGVVDAKRLAREFDKLSPAMREIVFQGHSAEAGQLIRLLAAKGGDVDLSKVLLSPGNKDIGDLLRKAAADELSMRRDFERGIIKPILRGELGITSLAPEDFVRHVLKTGSLDDVRTLFKLAPPELREGFQKRAIVEILSMAEGAAKEATQQIAAFQRGADPSARILDVMRKNFGSDAAASTEKLKWVLGEEGYELMKDVGVLSAARARKEGAAKAVGGLVGGSVLSNILTLQLSSAAQIARYRLASLFLTNRVTKAWMTNGFMYQNKVGRQTLPLVLPQIMRAVTAEFGEDSEIAAEINDYLQSDAFAKVVEAASQNGS